MKAQDFFYNNEAAKLKKNPLIIQWYEENKGVLFKEGFLGFQKGIVDLALLTNITQKTNKAFKNTMDNDMSMAFFYLLLEEVEKEGLDLKAFSTMFYKQGEEKLGEKNANLSINMINSKSADEAAAKLGFPVEGYEHIWRDHKYEKKCA